MSLTLYFFSRWTATIMPEFVGPSPKHLNHVLILSLNFTNYGIILAVLTIVHGPLLLLLLVTCSPWFSQLCDQISTAALEEPAEAAGSSLLQKQLLVHETAGAVAGAHPWDKHIFVVGTNHKAGSQLLRNIMAHFFDMLGATVSCQYSGHGTSVTSLNRDNDCTLFPAPIRFHNHISKDAIVQMKKEAHDMKGDLRGVMIVRDPLEMVASSYCYHHRGAESYNPMEKGIPEMGPEERQWETGMWLGFCEVEQTSPIFLLDVGRVLISYYFHVYCCLFGLLLPQVLSFPDHFRSFQVMQKAAACWFNRVAIWMWHMQNLKLFFCRDLPAMFDDAPKNLYFWCGLQEGVPEMAKRMLFVIEDMAEAYVPWLLWSS